ncbi:hypothetical protein SK128_008498, partial [Halocaridina rubra]
MQAGPVMFSQGNALRFDGQTERSYRNFIELFREYTGRNAMRPDEKIMLLIDACEGKRVKFHLRRYLSVHPDAEAACQKGLRYLEALFRYDEPPTEVLWARMREGRHIYDEDIRGLDGLQ